MRPRLAQALQVTPEELNELLADVSDVPGGRGRLHPGRAPVPLDFSLSAAYTVRIMEGFSAHDIASRREALAGLACSRARLCCTRYGSGPPRSPCARNPAKPRRR